MIRRLIVASSAPLLLSQLRLLIRIWRYQGSKLRNRVRFSLSLLSDQTCKALSENWGLPVAKTKQNTVFSPNFYRFLKKIYNSRNISACIRVVLATNSGPGI